MNTAQKLFVATHRGLMKLSGGKIGSRLAGIEHLLLTTVGRKTGARREQPLACFEIDGKLLVVASNGGADGSPAWYHNLVANPGVEIERRGKRSHCKARTADPQERAELWPQLVKSNRAYGSYEKKTERVIPVVVLDSA